MKQVVYVYLGQKYSQHNSVLWAESSNSSLAFERGKKNYIYADL